LGLIAQNPVPLPERVSDIDIVLAAQSGDRRAQEQLFRRYARTAAGIAFRLIGQDIEIEDIVQESFATALATLRNLSAAEAFLAWFARIVTGKTIAVIRRRRLLTRLGFVRAKEADLEAIISKDAPAEIVIELRALYALIDALPTEERVVLVLRKVEQLSVDEIVDRTGWPLGTVKRRLTRARERLEECLEGPRGTGRESG
jgi:RNA polymerase sigma-70 factor, ECF subfamily